MLYILELSEIYGLILLIVKLDLLYIIMNICMLFGKFIMFCVLINVYN
jgi:hypothetical protein